MKPRRGRWMGHGSLLLVLMLLLVACGGAPTTQEPTTAPAAGVTAAPERETIGTETETETEATETETETEATGTETEEASAPAEGEPIKLGAIFDLTGVTADVSNPYSEGQIAFIAWKNEQGGIGGRPLELIWADYGYEVPRAEELYTQYTAQEDVVAFSGWGTGDTEALRAKVSQDEIPFISASYSAELADPSATPYNFLVGTTYSDQLIIAQKWALEDWTAQGNSDAPKFAYLVNDSPFGRSPVETGTAHAAANGVEEPLVVPSPRGATDLTPQLTQINEYGANYIFIQNVSSPASLAIQNAASLGMEAQFVCLNWCANELLVQQAGDAAEGVVGAIPFAPPSSGAAGAQVALDYAEEQGIDTAGREIPFVQGWWAMAILVEGIERTVDAGEELTGPNIKASLETLDNFETGDVTAPITFTATDHAGSKALRVYQVQDGVWQPLTELVTAEQE